MELIALHVHGEEADLDAFFDDLASTLETKCEEGEKLFPSLEFLSPADVVETLDDAD